MRVLWIECLKRAITLLIAGGLVSLFSMPANAQSDSTIQPGTINLTGLWMGHGYTCRGAEPPEKIKIVQTQDSIVATKITGDDCVKAGEITWRGVFNANPFAVESHGTYQPGDPTFFFPAEARVESADLIHVGSLAFHRIKDEVVAPTTTLTFGINYSELEWEDSNQISLIASVKDSNANSNVFDFYFRQNGSPVEIFSVESSGQKTTLQISFSKDSEAFVISDESGEIAEIEPGKYVVNVSASDGKGGRLESGARVITLHPATLIKVYDPAQFDGADSLWQSDSLEEVIERKPFRIAVLSSPYRKEPPKTIEVVIHSSRDELPVSLQRSEHGGSSLAAYDMWGETVAAYGISVSSTADHLVSRFAVKPEGETIEITYGTAKVNLKVFPNEYEAAAKRLEEILRDYRAMYEALYQNIMLTPAVRSEFVEKANMLTRAIALHDPERDIPALVRITVSKAYFELIQRPISSLQPFRWRNLPSSVLGDRMADESIGVNSDFEERLVTLALYDADHMAMKAIQSIVADIAGMPIEILASVPQMLASPVYSGYTLLTGRQLDGKWASAQQKFFCGVEVALTFVGLSTSVLKITRPSLYEKALRRLRLADDPIKILPDEKLHGSRWPEIQEKINGRTNAIAQWEKTIANANKQLLELPAKRAALQLEIQELKTALEQIETESHAANRLAKNRAKIKAIEAKFKNANRPLTPNAQTEIQRQMHQLTKNMEKIERDKADLMKKLKGGQMKEKSFIEKEARAKQRIVDNNQRIVQGRYQIEEWKEVVKRGTAPAERRRIARRRKIQGNDGELLALEALSRDGFQVQVEMNGRLPNAMQNWKELGEVLKIFRKDSDDIAKLLGKDASEIRKLIAGTNVPDPKLLEKAREAVKQWQRIGVPYYPGGSIGPDALFWNPKTNCFRLVEVKTGNAKLGVTQLTDRGISRWIELMRNPANQLYRPTAAEALNTAFRSGTLERMVIRITDGKIVEAYLVKDVGGVLQKIPVA